MLNTLKNNIKFKMRLKINKVNLFYFKKIVKKYYRISIFNYVNPLKELMSKNVYITKKTVYNIYKFNNINKSNKVLKNNYKDDVCSKGIYHYGEINGLRFLNDNLSEINLFTPVTRGDFHEIYLDNIETRKLNDMNLNDLKVPTLKTKLEILNIEENKNLIFPNQSLVKIYIPENLKISINNNDVHEIDLKKAMDIKESKEKVMDILGLKDYEFIDKKKQLYLVPKKDILKQGEIIVNINFENAEKITVEKAIALEEKIAQHKELEHYLNISPQLKETFLKNNYDYFKYNKFIKKD